MKKLLLLTGFSLAAIAPALAQGYLSFTYTGSGFTTGLQIGSPSNPSAQMTGWYLGSDYTAEIYVAVGAGQAEGSLAGAPLTKTLMGFVSGTPTSASGGPGTDGSGLINGGSVDTGLPTGTDTIQVRAWYSGGGVTSYEAALTAGVNAGKSLLYNIDTKASTDPTQQSLDGINFAPFTVQAAVPEPSTFALAGLGAAALLILRRRK